MLVPSAAVLELLVARLPATAATARAPATSASRSTIRRASSPTSGARSRPRRGARPVVTLALAAPLGGWRLAYLGPLPARGRATFGIVGRAVRAGRGDRGRGLWLYRESTRELRLAGQRVSFVNQVSHELKTPLTNIRMYAELLEQHVAADDREGASAWASSWPRASGCRG